MQIFLFSPELSINEFKMCWGGNGDLLIYIILFDMQFV